MSEFRPCLISYAGKDLKAKFHMWGSAVAYDNGNNPFPITVGIVELESGEVREVDPGKVVFQD